MEDHHYPGHFWLEVYSPNASKGKGIEFLKKYLNASTVVSFGDGNNDVSMFEVSDKSYAVSNASDYVKSKSSAVIGSHNENSVAKFIDYINFQKKFYYYNVVAYSKPLKKFLKKK